ncbi:MAG: thiamine-phosphate kinase [Propylenella sp.]
MPLDELSIIDRYFRPLAGEGAFGLMDDAGLLDVALEMDLVVTTDMVACDVHFLAADPADLVARKALRVNISDLAAKGARPLAYLLSLAISAATTEAWISTFAKGLKEDHEEFGVRLLGGDTIEAAGGPVVSVAAFGAAPKGRMVHRHGGRAGDVLFVSGAIGAGTAGLALLKGEPGPWDTLPATEKAALIGRYRLPVPRPRLAPALAEFASAAMDISDGLVGDCDKLAAASGCSATIEAERVPLPESLSHDMDGLALARLLTGGDDYEILAAARPERATAFERAAAAAGVTVTRIGTLAEGTNPPQVLFEGRSLPLARRAFVHGLGGEDS